MRAFVTALAAFGWLVAREPHAQTTDRYTFSSGVDYSTGKYGSTTKTDVLYLPFVARYESQRWALKATVPYVQITSTSSVTTTGSDVVVIPGASTRSRETASGLGDVVTQIQYALVEGAGGMFVDGVVKVKLPTADSAKGLGTGKPDYASQIDLYKIFGGYTMYGTAGYRFVGSPEGVQLRNVAYGSLGAAYKPIASLTTNVQFDMREAIRAGASEQRELMLFAVHRLSDRLKLQFYFSRGLSNASPEWGGGLMLGYSYSAGSDSDIFRRQ